MDAKDRIEGEDGMTLMDRMMQAHSQPVVDDMQHRIEELVETAMDGGNFRRSEAIQFLVEVIKEMGDKRWTG